MEAELLLKALAYNPSEMEPKKFGDTLADLEEISYTLVEALGYV